MSIGGSFEQSWFGHVCWAINCNALLSLYVERWQLKEGRVNPRGKLLMNELASRRRRCCALQTTEADWQPSLDRGVCWNGEQKTVLGRHGSLLSQFIRISRQNDFALCSSKILAYKRTSDKRFNPVLHAVFAARRSGSF